MLFYHFSSFNIQIFLQNYKTFSIFRQVFCTFVPRKCFFSFVKCKTYEKSCFMKISKTQYLHTFAFVTIFLAIVRCVADFGSSDSEGNVLAVDTVAVPEPTVNVDSTVDVLSVGPVTPDLVPHRIYSVASFRTEFPDSKEV